ncbi:MAG: FtsX-like permease family protein [Vicinamibacterales bacterium]
MSLGSGGGRPARQLLVETGVLSVIGAVAGVAVAFGILRVLVAQAPAGLPRLDAVTIDLRVLGLAVFVALAAGVVFGLLPLWQALAIDPNESLRSGGGGRTAGGRGAARMRALLVVAETALAVVLVTGAGLLGRTLWAIQQVDPGFARAGVLKAEYQLPASRYPVDFRRFPDLSEQHAFTRAVLERARALPGVTSAAVAGNHPLDPGFTNSFRIVGRGDERFPEISIRRVTPGYFETVGLDIAAGRRLADGDTTTAPPVALINESARARLFGDRDPLGARIAFWGAERTIVGVTRDEHVQGVTQAAPIAVYVPLAQAPSTTGAGVLLLRTTMDPASLATAATGAVHAVDPQLAVFGVEPLVETFSRSIGEQRFAALLLSSFALMALALAAVGVYGVLSYAVARRTRELGIRMALGAAPSALRRSVIGEGLRLGAAGLAVGLLGAMAFGRALSSLLYSVEPTDPVTVAAVGVLLLVVALAASAIPARRATAVDPTEAMRTEG